MPTTIGTQPNHGKAAAAAWQDAWSLGAAALTARAEFWCYTVALCTLLLAPPAGLGGPGTRAALGALLAGGLASAAARAAGLCVLRRLAADGPPEPDGEEWSERLARWHGALRQAHWCWSQGCALALVRLGCDCQLVGQWCLLALGLLLVLCLWLVPARAGSWFCVGGWALLHTLAWVLAAVAVPARAGALCWYRLAALAPALAALAWSVARPPAGRNRAPQPVRLPHDVAWALATAAPDLASAYRLLAA